MLIFENYTIAYRDELDNGAEISTPFLILNPNKCLRITGPLLESTRLEILLGVIVKMFIRADSEFVEGEYTTFDNIEKNFEEAWTKFSATTHGLIVSRENEDFENLLDELSMLGFLTQTDTSPDMINDTVEIYLPTELFLAHLKSSFKIKEF